MEAADKRAFGIAQEFATIRKDMQVAQSHPPPTECFSLRCAPRLTPQPIVGQAAEQALALAEREKVFPIAGLSADLTDSERVISELRSHARSLELRSGDIQTDLVRVEQRRAAEQGVRAQVCKPNTPVSQLRCRYLGSTTFGEEHVLKYVCHWNVEVLICMLLCHETFSLGWQAMVYVSRLSEDFETLKDAMAMAELRAKQADEARAASVAELGKEMDSHMATRRQLKVGKEKDVACGRKQEAVLEQVRTSDSKCNLLEERVEVLSHSLQAEEAKVLARDQMLRAMQQELIALRKQAVGFEQNAAAERHSASYSEAARAEASAEVAELQAPTLGDLCPPPLPPPIPSDG